MGSIALRLLSRKIAQGGQDPTAVVLVLVTLAASVSAGGEKAGDGAEQTGLQPGWTGGYLTGSPLADLYARAGISHATAQAVPGTHPLDHPEDFWDVVLGSRYRATIDARNGEQRDAVRDRLLRSRRSQSNITLQTDVIFGTAARPHDHLS